MKIQTIFFKGFSQDALIALAEVENTQVAETVSYILDNLVGLCLIQDKFVPLLSKLLHQLHKGVGREGVVLGRDAKADFFRPVFMEPASATAITYLSCCMVMISPLFALS